MIDYTTVTEVSGDEVSQEQVQRLCNRYFWAGQFVKDKQILEIACGSGQGLKYLARTAKKVVSGDVCEALVQKARENASPDIDVHLFDAESLPFEDNSFDVVILFEAIYYIANPQQFLRECARVLKPKGQLLIATANKDLFDFNPSPYSHQYFGIVELKKLLNEHGFTTRFYGDTPLTSVSIKQKIFRPIKKVIVSLNLMPKSMNGKKFFKKLIFGKLISMPSSITSDTMPFIKPVELPDNSANKNYKVIFCEAVLS